MRNSTRLHSQCAVVSADAVRRVASQGLLAPASLSANSGCHEVDGRFWSADVICIPRLNVRFQSMD